MTGQIPLYQQILSWVDAIVGLVYPIGIVIILLLAWLDFRKLVAHMVSKQK